MKLASPVPILRSFDEQQSRDFYVEYLGFKIDWEHRFEDGLPLYMQLSHGDCVIHLSEHHGDCTPGAALRIEVDDIDAYHDELVARAYQYARPGIIKQPWGRDMLIIDPSGNRLVFSSLS